MTCFRYKLEHDYGFAPNPFHGVLTLATCKGDIRRNKNLKIGDWVVGLGSVAMGNLNHIIYAMQVSEILTFDQYWTDTRFECKKPVLNGSLVQMYGDNVYHTDPVSHKVIQEPCAHSNDDGSINEGHRDRDARGQNVLIAKRFYYFGDNCPQLPSEFSYIKVDCRGIKYWDMYGDDQRILPFVEWLETNYGQGVHGDPCNWKEFNLPKLDIYEE